MTRLTIVSETLEDLIAILQKAVREATLDTPFVTSAIGALTALGHKRYDNERFPSLREDTYTFDATVGNSPQTLAEALLWKLGKWQAYKTFARNFSNDKLEVSSDGGVVFSAFAKHLQDQTNPIYDQHAIRSIWAISSLNESERSQCDSLLFDRKGNWKEAGSGDDGPCYKLFVRHVNAICETGKVTHSELDKLLMPLGQAIKKSTKASRGARPAETDKANFLNLCWPKK